MVENMDAKDIRKIKSIKDANDDLNKLDELLGDTDKFRLHSNRVYDEITRKPEYAPYIVAARAKYKLAYGDTPFKDITNYMARRKIISILREAVIAYIEIELLQQ